MDKYVKKALYFSADLRNIYVSINANPNKLLHGSIAKIVLETDNEFAKAARVVADSVLRICNDACQLTPRSTEGRFDLTQKERKVIAKAYAKEATAAIEKIKELRKIEGDSLLKEIIYWLPAVTPYIEVFSEYKQRDPSVVRKEENSRNIRNVGRTHQEMEHDGEEFCAIRNDWGNSPFESFLWGLLLDALDKDDFEDDFSYAVDQYNCRNAMLDVLKEYCSRLERLCIELRKLIEELPVALGLKTVDVVEKDTVRKSLADLPYLPVQIWNKDKYEIFGDYIGSPNVSVYRIPSLSAFTMLDIEICEKYKYVFKHCAFCDGYFATRKKDTQVYCPYPNPQFDGLRCQIASKRDKTDMHVRYTKAVGKYSQWKNRTTKNELDYLILLEEKTISGYGEKAWRKLKGIINSEITSNFEKWRARAKSMLKGYLDGVISEEECLASFDLPKIEERAPILYTIREPEYVITKDYLRTLGIEYNEE